jgi:hypothetical protein
MQALLLWSMLHQAIDMSRAFLAGLFLFFALLGNVLGKVKRNFLDWHSDSMDSYKRLERTGKV